MGETAAERARRLRQISGSGEIFSRIAQGVLVWSEDERTWLCWHDICREMIDEVCDKPTVSLVKEYSKGSFKFV